MVTIEFKTDNAAFEGDGARSEIARILRELAGHVDGFTNYSKIRDVNGNTIGSMHVELEEDQS